MYPSFHATRMQMNSTTDSPTRMASARTMLDARLGSSGWPGCPPFIMKNRAEARLAMMPMNATPISTCFMERIIP